MMNFETKGTSIATIIVLLLIAAVAGYLGYSLGKESKQPTIDTLSNTVDRLRADSTSLTAAVNEAHYQGRVAQAFMEEFDDNITQLVNERLQERNRVDSALFRIARMDTTAAKRAVIKWYAERNAKQGAGVFIP